MKEAIVHPGPKVEIVDSSIPNPGRDQVVIKVVVSGSNPKDWKLPEYTGNAANEGDDIAGTIYSVGEGVTEFHAGDRVGAFHEMRTPHGSYGEYALAWAHTTFHLAASVSYEEAAAIPLAAMTAAVGLNVRLGLPEPWLPISDEVAKASPTPLVVYGASSAVGSYAVQLARKANIHPIIGVAGRAMKHVEQFLDASKGDVVLDYRDGDEKLVSNIKDALRGQKLVHAFDAVSEKGSYQNICKVLDPHGKITLVLPGREYPEIPDTVQQSTTSVGCVHQDQKDFGFVMFRYLAKGLKEGWFKAQPQEVCPGGLAGIQGALEKLKNGEASAVKYVFRIGDTKGVEKNA